MSSPLSSLAFEKINARTCIIREITQARDAYPNDDLRWDEFLQDCKTTGLIFLCELLSKNNIQNTLTQSLRQDLHLQTNESLTQLYFSPEITNKYVAMATMQIYVSEYANLNNLELSESKKSAIKNAILAEADPKNYGIYKFEGYEFEDAYETFEFHVLKNLEILEKCMHWDTISAIRPQMSLELVLNSDYLADIQTLSSIESCLDSHLNVWLPRAENA